MHRPAENAPLDRRAERDGFVRILRSVRLATENFRDQAAHERHARLSADENHFVEIGGRELRIGQRAAAMRARAFDDRPREIFQFRAREPIDEALRTVGKRQRNLDRILRRQAVLCRHGDIALLPIRNPQSAIRNQRTVDVVATEPRIAIGREHLEDPLIQFENRNVERAAAEVEDGDFRAVAQFIEAIRERGGGRFVNDSLDREAGDFARALRSGALRIVEISGHGNDGARDFHAERALGIGFQLAQNQRCYFLRQILAVADADARRLAAASADCVAHVVSFLADAATDEALRRINGRLRFERTHSRRRAPNERLALRRKMNDGRREALAICVGDEHGKPGVHRADE